MTVPYYHTRSLVSSQMVIDRATPCLTGKGNVKSKFWAVS
jgi:hypothetical protein